MIFTLMMQFLDKNALSSSVNFGLLDDMGLHGNEYNWAGGSIFYIAYLVAQPLVARLLQILPVGKYVAGSVIVVGYPLHYLVRKS
jgi:MFS transporter, ACS family, allantoate permease